MDVFTGAAGVGIAVASTRYGVGSNGTARGWLHARTLGYPWALRGVRGQDPSALSTDEGLEESGPALNGKTKELDSGENRLEEEKS